MKPVIYHDERGLTLVEILVAFVILTTALVTMLDIFVLGKRYNADTCRYNTAMALAQSKIEEIKSMAFNSVSNAALKSFSLESDYSQFDGFAYSVTVVDSGLITKTVTVTVYYEDEDMPKELAMTAEISNR
ncbi:MAG: hypothetical protein A4E55_01458 [Pelotomaculum sp. PtaU1.Bin035]|nr:MAG: hypothetical protein A4E55_01458 [Pelotomaculum sp. PtaU1.Bin035]